MDYSTEKLNQLEEIDLVLYKKISDILNKFPADAQPTPLPRGLKPLFFPTQPKCSFYNCNKPSNCIKLSCVVSSKKGVVETVNKYGKNVDIMRERPIEKRIEEKFTFLTKETIEIYCEYHEFNLKYQQKKEIYDMIVNSDFIFPISARLMDQLKNDNNSILYDEKTNCVYSNHIKIERDVEFYKLKMPKRHNINFEWSRITNLNCIEKIEKNVDYGDCTICIEPNDDFLKSRCTTCFSCFHKKCFPVDQENCPNCRVGKVGNYKGKSFISWEKAEKTESLLLRIFENIF